MVELSKDKVFVLQKEGHTFHCAMRILYGDGKCECSRKSFIPGSIFRCPICFEVGQHSKWCRNKTT